MRTALALALSIGTGCVTAHDIDGSDRGMLLPTARAWINTLPEAAEGRPRKGEFGVELSASGGEGDFDVDLDAGDTIRAGGGTISGPATVAADFRFLEATVAARGGSRMSRFYLHGIAGLGYHETRVDLRSGAQRLTRSIGDWGPVLGGQMGFEVAPWLELFGRGTILFLDELDLSESQQFEVGGRFLVADHISLIGGYRWWRFRQEDFSFTTDIDIRGGGVVFGVVIRF